ncbi:DNA primase family protein [Mycolicibacterium sp. J2]|uniref:DNA primase family protein n=1 Tax=Mycolicibacterium sp. J2 TaxID=2993511 RepID=UPI00224B3895|nr:phage/plasmid primase, P4 family [Mycolicibacterium sp. J2]MCX2712051.1 phage/plasmid primase, P4 family [Mycolicibacterium sp. J2]
MAYRLAEGYKGRLLHVHGLGWHVWDGKRFTPDDRGHATRAVLDILRGALADSLDDKELRTDVRRCESAAGIAGILDIAAALEPFAAAVDDLDADPYLLNVANGTLDLRTLALLKHDPANRLTKVTRAAYEPETQPGEWHQFLATVLPDEDVRAYVQRHVGMSLVGRVVEHVLSIWTGTGANGKGTSIGALCWALGDYASTAEPELLLHRTGAHPTGEMDLLGRRLVVMSETDEGRKLAEATMKRLTGGDTIRARRMRQDFIEFEPSHTPILVTNHLPAVSGDDPAVWRRIRVVPFDVVIPEGQRDGHLPERLQHAADEVLAWAIDGWRAYSTGGLAEPGVVRAKTSEYQAESDAVGRFITENCVTSSPALKATTGQLFDDWQKWRTTEGVAEMSQKAFGQALDRHGYPAGNATNGKRWREGIGLKSGDSGD